MGDADDSADVEIAWLKYNILWEPVNKPMQKGK